MASMWPRLNRSAQYAHCVPKLSRESMYTMAFRFMFLLMCVDESVEHMMSRQHRRDHGGVVSSA